ncbi:Fic family protein [Geomicrobium sp. JCM 19055]|uniref:Fic family protein n=1 Tax=Geomicrobium sp. JCM 19055 TaxID=1460649 RepID=UPI00045ECDEF|nr:Fic family protein [Geomicrobium sp. JCM 19055]
MENITNNQITERDVRNIHAIILRGIYESAGSYRSEEVLIQGASHKVTPSYLIKEHMNDLMNWYETSIADSEHPIVRAAMLHSKFVNVHPFFRWQWTYRAFDHESRISTLRVSAGHY